MSGELGKNARGIFGGGGGMRKKGAGLGDDDEKRF